MIPGPDLRDPALPVEAVRRALDLQPHPEGGFFREVWRDVPAQEGGRGASTSILFLLAGGQRSRWHRVDATEIWSWHAGAPLRLGIAAPDAAPDAGPATERAAAAQAHRLGPDVGAGETLQAVVPPHHWQEAESLGPWTLVGCVVAPAFSFDGFEMAPEGWEPAASGS